MNGTYTKAEREHVDWVKTLPCGVCEQSGPSDAHHLVQGDHFTVIPLCRGCHQCPHNGIHGQRHIWLVMKKDEMSVLNDTIKKLRSQR